MLSLKRSLFAAALLASASLAACSTLPNGDAAIGGVDTHIQEAKIELAQADVQKAVNALPQLCDKFAVAQALTLAEGAVLQTSVGLPSTTVAKISNASSKGLLLCRGTAAVVAPLATQ